MEQPERSAGTRVFTEASAGAALLAASSVVVEGADAPKDAMSNALSSSICAAEAAAHALIFSRSSDGGRFSSKARLRSLLFHAGDTSADSSQLADCVGEHSIELRELRSGSLPVGRDSFL